MSPPGNDFFAANSGRISVLANKFSSYVFAIESKRIIEWIKQFEPEHFEIALKLLEAVDYYDPPRVISELAVLGATIEQTCGKRLREIIFSGFTPPGKSGDWMLAAFRLANDLKPDIYQSNFIHLTELSDPRFKKLDTRIGPDALRAPVTRSTRPTGSYLFVFLDDYIGTGNSAIQTWANIQGETNDEDRYYLASLVATESGIEKIASHAPDLKLICPNIIRDSNKLLNDSNKLFTDEEKRVLTGYCKRAHPTQYLGYGGVQSVTIFFQRCADNVLPILHSQHDWKPLFIR